MAVVQLLLSHGADPEATNFHGATPGDLALAAGHAALANHLTRCIQDPSLSNIRESARNVAANRRPPFFAAFRRGSQINANPEDLKTLASSKASPPRAVAIPKSSINGVDLYSTRTGHSGYVIPSGELNSPIGHQPPHVLLNVDPGSLTTNFSQEVDQIQEALSQARISKSGPLPHPGTYDPLSPQVHDSRIGAFSQASAKGAFTEKVGASGHANTRASNVYVPSGPLSAPGASLKDVQAILKRGFEGEGTPGTHLKRGTHLWRCFAVICQVIHFPMSPQVTSAYPSRNPHSECFCKTSHAGDRHALLLLAGHSELQCGPSVAEHCLLRLRTHLLPAIVCLLPRGDRYIDIFVLHTRENGTPRQLPLSDIRFKACHL